MNININIKGFIVILFLCCFIVNINAQKEDVNWSQKKGVTENLSTKVIEKTSSTGINNATVKTQNILKANTDGEVEFKMADLNSNFIIGLTPVNRTNIYTVIAYSFHIVGNQVQIIENGNIIMSAGSVSLNDSLIIKREGAEIKYYKNAINLRTISTNPNYELIIDVSMVTTGSKVKGVKANFRRRLSAFAFLSNNTANDINDDAGIIDVNPTGGEAPYTYQWSNDATTKYINNLSPGIYSVVISDAAGSSLRQNYIIASLVSAKIPEHYIKSNGFIIKDPDSVSDSEMMISENTITNNGWTSAILEGENISFVFGLDSRKNDFENAEDIQIAILVQNNQMFHIRNGRVVARLGRYLSGEKITLILIDNFLKIYKNDILISTDELDDNTYYAKIALSKNLGGLKGWIHSKKWHPVGKTDFYATLTKKLDGSFYNMTNYINFKYKEKYNDDILDYKIYDWQRNIKMDNIGVIDHKYGVNYHSIAAYNYLDSDTEGYYTLEATNAKGEVYKMRFYLNKVGTGGVIQVPGFPESSHTQLCCIMGTCHCLPIIVNPCNPCHVEIGEINSESNYYEDINQIYP